MIAPHVAIEASLSDPVDPVLWGPESLLVGEEKRTVGVKTDAVGSAEAGRENFSVATILADTQECTMLRYQCRQAMARCLRVIKITLSVRLQTHGKFVEMLRDLMIAIETLVKVCLSVAVFVVQADDLVAASNVNPARNGFQAQGLEQPGGDSLPCKALRRLMESADKPDVSIPGTHGNAMAVG